MKKLRMRWAGQCYAQALAAVVLASITGCHLSRADAWDDKHKGVLPTVLETQVSQLHVAAGQAVTVRCAVARGSQPLTDVATTLEISPQQAWTITDDAQDPHAHTLVPTAQGAYRLTCTAPEASPQTPLVPHSVTLQVDPAEAVRWRARVASTATAGTRVPVRCTPVDSFGNPAANALALAGGPDAAPGFTITPDDRVQIDAHAFTARPAGNYTVICNASGTLGPSVEQEGQVRVQPGAPHMWWSVHDNAPLQQPRAVHCVNGNAPFTPPYSLRDRFNNPDPVEWRTFRVHDDGSVEPVSQADTTAPGAYRFMPAIHEFTDAARLNQVAWDMVRDPRPPQIQFDRLLSTPEPLVSNATDIALKTDVRATFCDIRNVEIDHVLQPEQTGSRSLSVPHRIDAAQWGLQRLIFQATDACGSTTRRVLSYIASPHFGRPDVEAAAPALAWQWSDATWRTILQQACDNAYTATPIQVTVDGVYPMPGDAADGADDAAQAERNLAVHHTAVKYDSLHVRGVTFDAAGKVAVAAIWDKLEISGTTTSLNGVETPVVLHLPQVQASIETTAAGGAHRNTTVALDLGDPSAAELEFPAPLGPLVALRDLPTSLQDALQNVLQNALAHNWEQAWKALHDDCTALPNYELDDQPCARPVLAEVAVARKFEGAWVQEARPRYTSAAWENDGRRGAAVHSGSVRSPASPALHTDRLSYSDDGINALLWSAWAVDKFAMRERPAPLKEVALTLPVVWAPDRRADSATLGVSARLRVEASASAGGQAYEGDMHGRVPVRVVWINNQLQVEAHPVMRPDWAFAAKNAGQAEAFDAAAAAAGVDGWLIAAVNKALQKLPKPQLLQSLPPPCHWQGDGAGRDVSATWTQVMGRVVCPQNP